MSILFNKNLWENNPFRCTQNIMQTRTSFVVCVLGLEEQHQETEQERGLIKEVVEVAEEEHGAEGGKPMEEPISKQPKGTEEATGKPMPTETQKTYPEKLAKKSALACKRSHPGNFIYLYSVVHDYATLTTI